MIEEGLFLTSHGFGGFYGGSFGNLLLQLEQGGVFTYLLPFLIIFAVIFGILMRMQIFGENKVINTVIAFSVSAMSLQFGFVSQFFSEIFPRMGIWLSVILVIFIVMGLLNPSKNWNQGIMVLVGIVILAVILVQTFGVSWYTGYWFSANWAWVLTAVLILVALGAIVSSHPSPKPITVPSVLSSLLGKNTPYAP